MSLPDAKLVIFSDPRQTINNVNKQITQISRALRTGGTNFARAFGNDRASKYDEYIVKDI